MFPQVNGHFQKLSHNPLPSCLVLSYARLMMKRIALGKAIKAIRVAQGRTAAEFATACQISDSHLHNIEFGRRPASPEHLATIAGQLGVDIDAISYEVSQEAVA